MSDEQWIFSMVLFGIPDKEDLESLPNLRVGFILGRQSLGLGLEQASLESKSANNNVDEVVTFNQYCCKFANCSQPSATTPALSSSNTMFFQMFKK